MQHGESGLRRMRGYLRTNAHKGPIGRVTRWLRRRFWRIKGKTDDPRRRKIWIGSL